MRTNMMEETNVILKECDSLVEDLTKASGGGLSILDNVEPEDGPAFIRSIRLYKKLKNYAKFQASRNDEMARAMDDLLAMVQSSNAKIEEMYKKVMEG